MTNEVSDPIVDQVTKIERVAPDAILAVIERAAKSKGTDIAKMESLLAMYERITARQAVADYVRDMNGAQGEIGPILTDADNTHTSSSYATYFAIDRAIRPIYTKYGFSLTFDTEPVEVAEMVRVVCHVAHRGGHQQAYRIDMPADGKGAKGNDVMTKTHATGSAVQYGRRYLVRMIFNLSTVNEEDDDGNAAGIEYISAEQAANLRAMATEIGANIPAYLIAIKARTFETIHLKRYADALATLEAKRRGAA